VLYSKLLRLLMRVWIALGQTLATCFDTIALWVGSNIRSYQLFSSLQIPERQFKANVMAWFMNPFCLTWLARNEHTRSEWRNEITIKCDLVAVFCMCVRCHIKDGLLQWRVKVKAFPAAELFPGRFSLSPETVGIYNKLGPRDVYRMVLMVFKV